MEDLKLLLFCCSKQISRTFSTFKAPESYSHIQTNQTKNPFLTTSAAELPHKGKLVQHIRPNKLLGFGACFHFYGFMFSHLRYTGKVYALVTTAMYIFSIPFIQKASLIHDFIEIKIKKIFAK